MTKRAEPLAVPTPVVVVGGVVAAVVVVLVLTQGLGRRSDPLPQAGERLAVARAGGPAGLAIVVPRCRGERVVGVELRRPDGTSRWRIVSSGGSIDERYVVGGDVPVGFDEEVAFAGPPPTGRVVAAADVVREGSRLGDEVTVALDRLPGEGALYRDEAVAAGEVQDRILERARCSGGHGPWSLALDVVGVVVVVVYGVLVANWWQARRRSPGPDGA